MYIKKQVKQYLQELSAKTPVPGGGSASALAGALSAALLNMYAGFSEPKNPRLFTKIRREIKSLEKKLAADIDLDAEAYGKLSAVFKLPKEDPKRQALLQKSLKQAALVPMDICRNCARVLELCQSVLVQINLSIVSDLAAAAVLAQAAAQAAEFSVRANLKYIKDQKFAAKTLAELKQLKKNIAAWKKTVLAKTQRGI